MTEPKIESTFQKSVLQMLGELDPEPNREGLLDTPRRVEKAMRFYCQGYEQDPTEVIGTALFAPETDEMVVVRDIELYSMCEHHLAPFYGKAHVAYIPSDKIVGLSKIAPLGRRLCAAAAGAGASDPADRFGAQRRAEATRSGGGDSGLPPVHDDARRPKSRTLRR